MTGQINKRFTWIDKRLLILLLSVLTIFSSCQKDPEFNTQTSDTPDGTTPYEISLPSFMPPMPVPPDNPLTVEGIELGRNLFYEPLLSKNNKQSCSSCHQQKDAFTDNGKRVSVGVDGFEGFRNTMPLMNLAWADRFFWDGKARTLEELISIPIMAEFEMHENIDLAIGELNDVPKYHELFADAFGDEEITEERIQKAVAQFLRSIVGYTLKLAPQNIGRKFRTNEEELGFQVFLDETKGDCFHCHISTVLNTNYQFMNNGLNENPIEDPGLYAHTGNPDDIGKFRVPSLYNLAYTAPYMHDGRFNTLEEVLDFYDHGFHTSPTLDVGVAKHADKDGNPVPRTWTEQEKQYLIKFLLSLQDTSIIHEERLSKPVE